MTATGSKETPIDYSGQAIFIGIDVHKKQWTITLRTGGLVLRTFSMNPSPAELHRYLTRHYPGGCYHSVYEAGFSGFWAHRELVALGIDNRVTHAADVPTSHKDRDRRNDRIDSRKLAAQLEQGGLRANYIPGLEQDCFRSLSRQRFQLTSNLQRVKCRIKSLLNYYGITLPEQFGERCWSRCFVTWLQSLPLAYGPATLTLQFWIAELTELRQRLLAVTRHLRVYLRQEPHRSVITRLRSVPGVGPVVVATLYAEIMEMTRFKNLDQLAAWVGLIPSIDASDEREHQRGITSRHNKYLRYLLVEAAWRAIRVDPALNQAFQKLCQRMKQSQAIIRIAKKLLNRIRTVWLSNTHYVRGVVV